MKKLNKYSILIMLFVFHSCNTKCNVDGIEVSELLLTVSSEKSYNYCSSLENAIKGNKNSVKELALLEFNDSSGYDHGTVLVELVEKIGEKKFINAISLIHSKDKNKILEYLEVGIIYNENESLNNKKVEEVFPILYAFLIS